MIYCNNSLLAERKDKCAKKAFLQLHKFLNNPPYFSLQKYKALNAEKRKEKGKIIPVKTHACMQLQLIGKLSYFIGSPNFHHKKPRQKKPGHANVVKTTCPDHKSLGSKSPEYMHRVSCQ